MNKHIAYNHRVFPQNKFKNDIYIYIYIILYILYHIINYFALFLCAIQHYLFGRKLSHSKEPDTAKLVLNSMITKQLGIINHSSGIRILIALVTEFTQTHVLLQKDTTFSNFFHWTVRSKHGTNGYIKY